MRFTIEVAANAFETGIVDKGRQGQLPHLLRLSLTRERHADDTIRAYLHLFGVLRYYDARQNGMAFCVYQLTVFIFIEMSVTGVRGAAVRQLHLEEAFAFDSDIGIVAGHVQAALSMHALGRDRTYAGTQLEAAWQRCLFGSLCTGLAHGLIKQILEHRSLALKAVGIDVRQVV